MVYDNYKLIFITNLQTFQELYLEYVCSDCHVALNSKNGLFKMLCEDESGLFIRTVYFLLSYNENSFSGDNELLE